MSSQTELPDWTLDDWSTYFTDVERRKKVLNVISLEFSNTPLQEVVQSPHEVRKMDWIDNVRMHWSSRST